LAASVQVLSLEPAVRLKDACYSAKIGRFWGAAGKVVNFARFGLLHSFIETLLSFHRFPKTNMVLIIQMALQSD
jgi:hypothetical protein